MHSPESQNLTRAMEYLMKAAAHRSDDAHYSLAMLYRCDHGRVIIYVIFEYSSICSTRRRPQIYIDSYHLF
jgi:hypothetical protein